MNYALGPTYHEFSYRQHPAITSTFFTQKKTLVSSV